jgi:hypothetical protein|tara:strand:+ start:387 stop:632 length:246 start_codon:yes stop_codon:yes gene_type:complete
MSNHYKPKVKKCVNCQGDFEVKQFPYNMFIDKKPCTFYHTEEGYFCSEKCSKEFGIACAEQGVRRLGQSLVRYKKGDRRAS